MGISSENMKRLAKFLAETFPAEYSKSQDTVGSVIELLKASKKIAQIRPQVEDGLHLRDLVTSFNSMKKQWHGWKISRGVLTGRIQMTERRMKNGICPSLVTAMEKFIDNESKKGDAHESEASQT